MGYIVCIFALGILIFCKIIKERFISPISIFALLWFVVAVFSLLRLFDINETSEKAYSFVLIGMTSFSIGGILGNKNRIVFHKPQIGEMVEEFSESMYCIRYKFVYVFCVVTIIYLITRSIKVTALLSSGLSMEYIRMNFASLVLTSKFDGIIENFVAHPSVHILVPLAMYDLIIGKRNKILCIFAVIIASLYAYCDGGRIVFVFIMLHFLLAVTFKNYFDNTKTGKKALYLICAVVMGLLSLYAIQYISESRNSTSSIWKQVYIYICGCMPHLSIRIDSLTFVKENTYGMAFFQGIIVIILFFLKNSGFIADYPQIFYKTKELLDVSDFVSIGTQRFNAFVTPFYYFYVDFGYFGIIAGSVIYGYISYLMYHMAITKKDVQSVVAYMFMVQTLVMSMVRWQFYLAPYVLAFVYLIIFTERKIPVQA